MIAVQGNRSHGWPYCYTPVLGLNLPTQPQIPNPNFPPPVGFGCTQAIPALYTLPAHSAPLGLSWGPPAGWPEGYRDDLFEALHGSWNSTSTNFRDCKVQVIKMENGQISGDETFIND